MYHLLMEIYMIVLDIFDDKCTVIIIRRKKTNTIMGVKYVCILFVAMLIFEINYMSASDQHIKSLLFLCNILNGHKF